MSMSGVGKILCYSESWLNKDMDIYLTGFSMTCKARTADSGKTKGGGVCLIANNSWCTISNVKKRCKRSLMLKKSRVFARLS